ncbi:MAG: tandem-95 repeat protein, partial [Bacteroidetes bacterium]|nr:tandem-95 repeat protein [Bacteroidota bacterium]
DDGFTMSEDGALSASVATNDSDPDNTLLQLTWSLVSGGTAAANGVLSLNADGTFAYTPAPDFHGTVSFSYEVCDLDGACASAVVTIVVDPVNDGPVAGDDGFDMNEDDVLSASVGGNDSDPDGDALVWSLVSGGSAASNGTLVFNGDGSFSYAPSANYTGAVSFTYEACDPSAACAPAMVTIVVHPVNDGPVAQDDGYDMNEDDVLSASVAGNDSDPDGDALTWSLVSGGSAAANGTLVFNGDGSFSYTPSADYSGTVSFAYEACDPSAVCAPAVATIMVHPVNDGPVAGDDGFDMNEDDVLSTSVSGNDSDVDGEALVWSLVSGGSAVANGVLVFNSDGSFSYTPAADYTGTVTFSYEACDPSAVCAPAVVTIMVHPVNDGPVAGDDGFDMNEDDVLSTSVSGNDSDPDGDALVWSLVSSGTASVNGVLVFNNDGSFSYIPSMDYTGTVSFTYEACDPSAACAPAVVTIVVHPVNDGPVAGDDGFDMNEDDVLSGSVAGNDSDVDGDALTWSLVSGGSAATNGTLVFNSDGSFSYTPAADYTGTATFTYGACDPSAVCASAVVTIVVLPVNDSPMAGDDGFDMNEDDVLNASVAGNDNDPDGDALVWSLVSGGSAAANGVLVFNGDGNFTYTPAADYSGTVSFTYEACDPSVVCAPAVVTIVVHPVNDGPVAGDDAFDMNEDDVLNASVAGNDNDPDGDALTWSLVSGGSAAANGTLVFNNDGSFTYTPSADYTGTVSFTYEACDPSAVCAPAVVTIVVHPVNDGPVAGDDSYDMNEDDVLNTSVSGNDSDPDGDALVWSLVSGGSAASNGVLVFNSDGTFAYTPTADYSGTVSFAYEACDPSAMCASAVVTIVVHPVNDGPVAQDDGYDMDEDDVLSASVSGNDSDVDGDALVWSLVGGGSAAANGVLVFNDDGNFTYTPAADYSGTVSFTYEACDPSAVCAPAVATIMVHPVNDGPVAGDDGFDMNEDDVLSASVAGNDSDVDGDVLVWSLVNGGSAAANGVLVFNSDGSFSYAPSANYTGAVSFTYEACDPSAVCAPAVVTIVVHPVNDGPVAQDDSYDMNEDDVLSGSVAGNDNDPDGDALMWSLVNGGSAAANGTLVFNGDGSFAYTPSVDYTGTVSFTYEACDPSAVCAPAVVTIVVHPVNDGPVAQDDSYDTNEDDVLSASVAGNDSDPDGDALAWSLVSGGTASVNGVLVFNNDGSFTYTPAVDYTGTVSFSYEACDPSAVCAPAVATIVVHPVNDGPVAQDDSYDMNEDDVLNASVAGNDNDPDGDALTWSLVSGGTAAANGTLVFNSDGSFSYTPSADYTGTVTFTYEACDPSAVCAPAVVTIVVHPVNDGPVAGDDGFDMNEDDVLNASVSGNDSDVDGDALVWSLVSGGTASVNGVLVFNNDGLFTYTPAVDYTGTVTFSYEACDPSTVCAPALATIVVHPVNDGPVAQDDSYDMNEDDVLSASVSGNDSDSDGDALVWSLVSGGTAASNGVLVFNSDGSFSYTPSADYTGTVSFIYEACDPSAACAPGVVTIVVHPVNDGPMAGDDGYDMNEDDVLSASVAGNDSDVDGDALAWSLVSGGSAASNGTLVFNNNGAFTYTPAADYSGTVSFTYEACDPSAVCAPAVVTIVVHPINDPPIAVDDAMTTGQNTGTTIAVLPNDSDPDGDALAVTTATALHGTVSINGDGTLWYEPTADWCGTDTISYTVCDGGPLCAGAIVVVTVDCPPPVNHAPVAVDDAATTDQNTGTTIAVLPNDSDPDGDALTVTTAMALHGAVSINGDGTLWYEPTADWCGTDTISYTVCDGGPLCAGAIVVVTVDCLPPVNHAPVAVDDAATTDQNTGTTIVVLSNDSDPDGDALTVTMATALHGTVSINGDGTLWYEPTADWCGTDTISYTVCDGGPLCAGAIVVVTVDCPPLVNHAPVAVDDAVTIDQNTGTTIAVLTNDSDSDGDALMVTAATAMRGVVLLNADGTLDYKPGPDHCGTDTISYTVCDGGALCDQALVVVTITCTHAWKVPQGFSPNGDGVGDTWVIQGIDAYPQATVSIINRWGSEVFKASPYATAWDGRSSQGLLPAGTYWYIIDLGVEGREPLSGYVYLNR